MFHVGHSRLSRFFIRSFPIVAVTSKKEAVARIRELPSLLLVDRAFEFRRQSCQMRAASVQGLRGGRARSVRHPGQIRISFRRLRDGGITVGRQGRVAILPPEKFSGQAGGMPRKHGESMCALVRKKVFLVAHEGFC